MPLILLFLAGAAGLFLVADWSALFVGVDGWELALRVLAAGALILHPVHEQRKGFRGAFNMAAWGVKVRRLRRGQRFIGAYSNPLSRTMNRFQAAFLVTVFPALALVGPWWAVAIPAAFYVGDLWYTHDRRGVPGAWSAGMGHAATLLLLLSMDGPMLIPFRWPHLFQTAGGLAAGLILLAAPWVLAYYRVRRAS